jgi:GT2 family glycosyltransferase
MFIPPPALSVVIPVFNRFDMTRQCLLSLREHTPCERLEVIVVDNASSDQTASELAPLGHSLFGDGFTRIRLEANRNFGPASNLGAHAAHGDTLFLLNNDTLLPPGWLPPLLAELDGTIGIASPLLLYPLVAQLFPNRVQHLGVACGPQLHPSHLYEFFPETHPVVRKPRPLQFVTGAAMFLPRALFSRIGGFCEEFINGGEDLDFCVRVREAGYRLTCVPESRIYHYQSQTPGRHSHERHNARVFKKHCLSKLYPDLHAHLARDGYEIALNNHLLPHAKLPDRRRAILEKAFVREESLPDLATCHAFLEKEPLFEPAYDRLIELYAAMEAPEQVVGVRFLQSCLFPGRDAGVRLREAARACGNTPMEDEGDRIIAFYDKLTPEDLLDTARHMIVYSETIGQSILAEIYRNWLARR